MDRAANPWFHQHTETVPLYETTFTLPSDIGPEEDSRCVLYDTHLTCLNSKIRTNLQRAIQGKF